MESFDHGLIPEDDPRLKAAADTMIGVTGLEDLFAAAPELKASAERRTSDIYAYPQLHASDTDDGWSGQSNTAL